MIVVCVLVSLGHGTLQPSRHLRGLAAATLAGGIAWQSWPFDRFDHAAWMRLPRAQVSLGATYGAVSLNRYTPAKQVLQLPKTFGGELWVRVRTPLAPLTQGLGTIVLIPYNPKHGTWASETDPRIEVADGTLQDLIDQCGLSCLVQQADSNE